MAIYAKYKIYYTIISYISKLFHYIIFNMYVVYNMYF